MGFWDRVNQLIKDRNTTQAAVASEAGINYRTFRGWSSLGRLPDIADGASIARALGVSVEYLVETTYGPEEGESALLAEKVPETYSTDPWVRNHRQLIDDLKTLGPGELAGIEIAIHGAAEVVRAKTKQSTSAS